jgi:glyoxylase-like metal-dependent hydrolase (beta-lactamase superfamily II)
MTIQRFEFNPLQENTYVLFDDTKECVIIDPGCYDAEEREELTSFISANNLVVKALWNTHCHIDHVLGNAFVKRTYNTKLWIHPADEPVLKAVSSYASNYGFHQYEETSADEYFKEDQQISFGDQSLKVLFLPGHAPGHVGFYHEAGKVIIAGDVLFYNSIGRTDLPGGNYDTLIRSIQEKLFLLPDDVTVYPGHGPETSIGYEKRTNPFCAIIK